jgi:membrane protein YqaA with SNARE-associated domain
MNAKQRLKLFRILAFVLAIGISIFLYLIRDQVRGLAQYGYPGIFILSILANATIILPAPGVVFVFAMGAVFNPLWVALAAGAGAAIGELFGYLIGFSGQGVVENAHLYQKILDWMKAHRQLSYLAIALLAFIPNPLFDLAGIAAGTLKIPIISFLIFTFIGKTLKMILLAYAGASSLQWLFGR